MAWWLANMGKRISERLGSKPKTSSLDRLAAEVAQFEIEHTDARDAVSRAEQELDAALYAVTDGGGSEAAVAGCRAELAQAREQVADLSRLIAKSQAQLLRERQNHEVAQHARRVQATREHADGMTDAWRQIVAGCDLIVAGAKLFYGERERFLEVCPSQMRPEMMPHLWLAPEVYVGRYIGARCPFFRSAAVRSGQNLDHLALVNEPLELHADALAQVFGETPTSTPAQAA